MLTTFLIVFGMTFSISVITSMAVIICRRCMNKRHSVQVIGAPIVVTSATHTAPGGYPVSQMPVGATTTATGYQTQAYPAPQAYAAPYPPQGVPTQMPMPMPASQPPVPGLQPYVAPYPPMANDAPPSYDMAVSGAGAGVPNNGTYEKQAPYNPNFSG
ncbi:uncharacterized protein isoform X10 [Musca autumnalis]|uniref:uncharacterized protein isoform X10 n=1 Tax=Musca autumnalis TaxID=221902 RepID=UPI003CF961AE